MTNDELEALLLDIESHSVERKESYRKGDDRIPQAICAFANDLADTRRPGVLFIGVSDDGVPTGLDITDQLLLTLTQIRSDGNIAPFPSLIVEKRNLRGADVAVVIVQPSPDTPVRYKGVTWVRPGPSRGIASSADEAVLSEKRRSLDLPFDLRAVPQATIRDLNLTFFQSEYLPSTVAPEVLEANGRTIEEQLASTRFVARAGEPHPTVFGLLVGGIDPRHFIPSCYVQFVRLAGEELVDHKILDQAEMSGPIPQMIREVEAKLSALIATPLVIGQGPRDRRSPDYPFSAIQQIFRNAVMHRTWEATHAPIRVTWFSDRIEIQNPGGPFGRVNSRNFGEPGVTDYRNPHVAEGMKNLGFVQRFGFGIQGAQRDMKDNGNPRIDFRVEPTHVLAILRRPS